MKTVIIAMMLASACWAVPPVVGAQTEAPSRPQSQTQAQSPQQSPPQSQAPQPQERMAHEDSQASSWSSLPVYEREHLQTNPQAYARYMHPGQCYAAALRARQFYWRDKRIDTIVSNPMTDTLSSAVVAVARACGKRFDVDKVPVQDLVSLVHLYLWSDHPGLAKRAVGRLMHESQAVSAKKRSWILYNLLIDYETSMPIQVDEIHTLVARLDSLGASGATASMLAHSTMQTSGFQRDDVADVIAQGEAAIHAGQEMSKDEHADEVGTLASIYSHLQEGTRIQHGMTPALAVVERSKPDLLSARASDPQQTAMIRNWIERSKIYFPFYASHAQAIQARYWFNTHGDTTALPQTGKVTVVFFLNANCGGACYPTYALLRRLYAQYAPAGVDFLLVSRTQGFFRRQVEDKSADEVKLIRDYFLDFLKLPGTLAVVETQFAHRTDGRRVAEPDVNQKQWPPAADIVVVGKDLSYKYITTSQAVYEKVLKSQIGQALQE